MSIEGGCFDAVERLGSSGIVEIARVEEASQTIQYRTPARAMSISLCEVPGAVQDRARSWNVAKRTEKRSELGPTPRCRGHYLVIDVKMCRTDPP